MALFEIYEKCDHHFRKDLRYQLQDHKIKNRPLSILNNRIKGQQPRPSSFSQKRLIYFIPQRLDLYDWRAGGGLKLFSQELPLFYKRKEVVSDMRE
jgi:hypothetical protein